MFLLKKRSERYTMVKFNTMFKSSASTLLPRDIDYNILMPHMFCYKNEKNIAEGLIEEKMVALFEERGSNRNNKDENATRI